MGRLCFFTNEWASGEIRGRQMAKVTGGVVDPERVSVDDVLVFIKSRPSDRVVKYLMAMYIDVDDNHTLIPYLSEHREVHVIAASRVGQQYLKEQTGRDDILLIPSNHCNYERFVKVMSGVKTAGFIGYRENLHLDVDELRSALGKVGIDFVIKTEFKSREEVCDFYKSIDIQICFRQKSDTNPAPELRDPLKLINAGSFGIPTVAYPEPSYADEFGDCFLPAMSLDKVVEGCEWFKNNGWFYHEVAMAALQCAEHYHIEHIAPMFLALLDTDGTCAANLKYMCALFNEHRPQKISEHAEIYAKIFAALPRAKATLLEIGVADGRSMRVWSDFLCDGSIFGIDTVAATESVGRATILVGNQSDVSFLKRVIKQTGPLDVVIDDGSHKPEDQIISLKELLPNVSPGGYYIIEDLYYGGYGPTVDFVKSLGVDFELVSTSRGKVDICVIKVH